MVCTAARLSLGRAAGLCLGAVCFRARGRNTSVEVLPDYKCCRVYETLRGLARQNRRSAPLRQASKAAEEPFDPSPPKCYKTATCTCPGAQSYKRLAGGIEG